MRTARRVEQDLLERAAVCFALVVLYTQGWEEFRWGETQVHSRKSFNQESLTRLAKKHLIQEVGKSGTVVKLTDKGKAYAQFYLRNLTGLDAW